MEIWRQHVGKHKIRSNLRIFILTEPASCRNLGHAAWLWKAYPVSLRQNDVQATVPSNCFSRQNYEQLKQSLCLYISRSLQLVLAVRSKKLPQPGEKSLHAWLLKGNIVLGDWNWCEAQKMYPGISEPSNVLHSVSGRQVLESAETVCHRVLSCCRQTVCRSKAVLVCIAITPCYFL